LSRKVVGQIGRATKPAPEQEFMEEQEYAIEQGEGEEEEQTLLHGPCPLEQLEVSVGMANLKELDANF
jgi:hypothetical protein